MTAFAEVGASPFGVVDMVGNGYEWCLDSAQDGSATVEGSSNRSWRGSAWTTDQADACRITTRHWDGPGDWSAQRGFRIALSL